MLCPNCGTYQPNGTLFCGVCGARIEQRATAVNGYRGISVSKKEYFATMASEKTRTTVKLLPLLVLVCIAVILIGHFVMLNTSIEDIPCVSVALGDNKDEFDDVKDGMKNEVEEIEYRFEQNEDEFEDVLSSKEVKLIKQFIKDSRACSKTFSINNIKSMVKTVEKICDTDIVDYVDFGNSVDDLYEVVDVLGIISTVMIVLSLLSLLFTIIGGLCRVRGLVIAGLIFSTLFCLVMYGLMFVLLNAATHIVLIKLLGDINKEYKEYRATGVAAL